jgi:PKD repeat protein
VGGTGTPYSNFSASPTFGTAPLAVHFWATVGVSSVLYNVNFGDGTSASLQPGGCPTVGEGPCTTPYADHTYTQTGTYTATLTGPCVQTDCTIGTVTVTVSQASRSSGGSCIAYQTTYANGATIQYLGEPGPGIPETLGLFASQWTCSNGQWVSATQTTTSQSCTTPWGTTVASGQTAQGFCPGAGSIPAGGECGLTEMCSNSQWTPTTTVNPGPNNGGNPNTSCTFANTTEGSECGGLYMCGVGVDGEYWTTKYPCPPFS